ncbi:MAG: transcription repressor NadR [Peptococcaceae bacterium]|nr:transcription repressor NadR [Peptococcaceae bacterium]MDH7524266.1 transcription repressor NadR [Peptococcaceae bacterium]
MDAEERRERLLWLLREREKPVSGGNLAELLGVSRQVVVHDIAILRAKGEDIMATPQGYVLFTGMKRKPCKVFAVRHTPEEIEDELKTIIIYGGKVLDVIVEHPLYGELRGMLMLASLADLQEFMTKYRSYEAKPLSALTGGVHLHSVEADNEQRLLTIEEELRKKNYLLDEA